MTSYYIRSRAGKWHRVDCPHGPRPDDAAASREDLPIGADHCGHCIGSFEFVGA